MAESVPEIAMDSELVVDSETVVVEPGLPQITTLVVEAPSLEFQQEVFLAFRHLFTDKSLTGSSGKKKSIMSTKRISWIVSRNIGEPAIADLVELHGVGSVAAVIKSLLKKKVFQFHDRAEEYFSTKFDPLPPTEEPAEEKKEEVESNERAIACAESANGETCMNGTPPALSMPLDSKDCSNLTTPILKHVVAEAVEEDVFIADTNGENSDGPLFPTFIPFPAQHRLMVQAQKVLEHACFAFGQRRMPEILRQRRWLWPQSVELNCWTDHFMQNPSLFLDQGGHTPESLAKLFESVGFIRQVAVHRKEATAKRTDSCLQDAESFIRLLSSEDDNNDEGGRYLSMMSRLRHEMNLTIESLEQKKFSLLSKLEETKLSIARQRAELDRLEQEAVAEMERQDGENLDSAAQDLHRAVNKCEAMLLGVVDADEDSSLMSLWESVMGSERLSIATN